MSQIVIVISRVTGSPHKKSISGTLSGLCISEHFISQVGNLLLGGGQLPKVVRLQIGIEAISSLSRGSSSAEIVSSFKFCVLVVKHLCFLHGEGICDLEHLVHLKSFTVMTHIMNS